MKGSDATQGLYTSQSSFNAGASYLEHLAELQALMTNMELTGDINTLLNIMYVIYADYSPPWTGQERQVVLVLLDEINDLLHPSVQNDRAELTRKNLAVDKLRSARRVLMKTLHAHGQLVPLTMNPAHAVTQGSG